MRAGWEPGGGKNGVWDTSKSKSLLDLLETTSVELEISRNQLNMLASHNVSWISNV